MNDPAKIRVLMVDDSLDLAHLYQLTMDMEPDLECVGSLSSTRTLVDSVAKLNPDVVLIDLVIPGEDVLAEISALRARYPSLQILILSGYEAPTAAGEANRAGASGYISKNCEPEDVLRQVREAYRKRPVGGG